MDGIQQDSPPFHFEDVVYNECAGEDVHLVMDTIFDYRLVVTPSGDQLYLEPWREGATGTMTGMDTGRVWIRCGVVSPFIYRDMGGEMTHWTYKGLWVCDADGSSFMEHEWYHLSYDANGELRVDRYDITCKPKPWTPASAK